MAIIMILDIEIKNRLSEYLKLMESVILIKLSAGDDSVSKNIIALVDELFLEFMPELKADIDPL
jgi:alkyl hydroperoxide reductase subunit F